MMSDAAMDVTLREVTRKTVLDIVRLKVAPEQALSIAEAHFAPDVAWFRAIYSGETPVGFVMLEADEARAHYFLWRFMMRGFTGGVSVGWRSSW